MHWLYKALMAIGIIGGAAVTGGLLPAGAGAIFAATGTIAGLLHEKPGSGQASK
jgi:hypothetical protein